MGFFRPTSRRTRRYFSLPLAFALLLAQWAGLAHSFEHLRYELSLAQRATTLTASGTRQAQWSNAGTEIPLAAEQASSPASHDVPPSLGHDRDHCVVFHALDCAAVAPQLPVLAAAIPAVPRSQATHRFLPASVPPFSSRAPPRFLLK